MPQNQYMPLPLTMSANGPIIQPSEVLQARTILKGNQEIHQVLVQWDQHTTSEATWEDVDDLQKKFPSYNLEDKVVFNGDGIAMRPNVRSLIETSGESANLLEGPQNMEENNSSITGGGMLPRRGERARKSHSLWKEFVKP